MNNTPLEAEEQKTFVEYLKLRKIKHSAIPNSTFTRSWKQKMNNKLMGVNAGLPDLLLIIKDRVVFIEMKRAKGGRISNEQELWINCLNKCDGVNAYVCYSCDEAINLVEELTKIK